MEAPGIEQQNRTWNSRSREALPGAFRDFQFVAVLDARLGGTGVVDSLL